MPAASASSPTRYSRGAGAAGAWVPLSSTKATLCGGANGSSLVGTAWCGNHGNHGPHGPTPFLLPGR